MSPNRPGDLLHRLQPRAHHPARPFVQEPPGPRRASVLPEPLELLPQEIGPYRSQVVLQELRQLHRLLVRQVLRALQEAPPRTLQDRLVAVALQSLRLLRPDLVDRLAALLPDVETGQVM